MSKRNMWQQLVPHQGAEKRLNLHMTCALCHRYHPENVKICKKGCIFAEMSNMDLMKIIKKGMKK
jgi:hypothetical protein